MSLTVFTQRNIVADSSSEVRFYTEIGHFAFSSPLLGDIGATYDDHLRLIGKHVVDFLLVLIDLYSLALTAEVLRANIGSNQQFRSKWGRLTQNFQVGGVAPINHLSSQKTT